jgi:tetratricopeptide (TPR) repeat protein
MLHLILGASLIGHPEAVEKAESAFDRVSELTGGQWEPRYAWLAGKMEYYAGRYEYAEKILLEAIHAQPARRRFRLDSRLEEMSVKVSKWKDPRLYAFLALTCRAMGKLEETRHYINIYRQILPENPWIDYESGRVYIALGDLKNAIKEFTLCIDKDAYYPWAYFQRGRALNSLGNTDKAIIDLQRFVELMGPDQTKIKAVKEARHIINEITRGNQTKSK